MDQMGAAIGVCHALLMCHCRPSGMIQKCRFDQACYLCNFVYTRTVGISNGCLEKAKIVIYIYTYVAKMGDSDLHLNMFLCDGDDDDDDDDGDDWFKRLIEMIRIHFSSQTD